MPQSDAGETSSDGPAKVASELRQMVLEDFSIYWDSDAPPLTWDSMAQLEALMQALIGGPSSRTLHSYIVEPSNLSFRLHNDEHIPGVHAALFQCFFELLVPPLGVRVTAAQWQDMATSFASLSSLRNAVYGCSLVVGVQDSTIRSDDAEKAVGGMTADEESCEVSRLRLLLAAREAEVLSLSRELGDLRSNWAKEMGWSPSEAPQCEGSVFVSWSGITRQTWKNMRLTVRDSALFAFAADVSSTAECKCDWRIDLDDTVGTDSKL